MVAPVWRTSFLAVSVALPGGEGAAAPDLQTLEAALAGGSGGSGGLSPEASALAVSLRAEQKRARAAALAPALAAVLRAVDATRLRCN